MVVVRNLLRRKARSLLTVLGVAVGLSVYVAVSAIAGDIRRQAREVLRGYDTDIVVLGKGAPNPLASRISWDDLHGVEALLGAQDVSPVVLGSLREKWNPYTLVIGVDRTRASGFRLTDGRPLGGSPGEALVGTFLADKARVGPGGHVTLAEERFAVAGVYASGNRVIDGGVVLELAEAQRLLRLEKHLNLILVRVRGPGPVGDAARLLNQRFPNLRAAPGGEFVGNIRLFRTIEAFARAVAAIALVAACIVAANTLLMSVWERTREIGILTAIGWPPGLLLRVLFWEALLLCALGALLGNVLAVGVLRALSRSDALGFGWVPMTAPWRSVAASVGISAAVAAVSVVYPAVVALRLSPAAALRHE